VLVEIARSRTEPANRVERAGIILAYLNEPSAYAVARTMGVSQPTVTRCLERAAEFGVLAALDDRARTGREATITAAARTWLVGLACAKPKRFGYPHARTVDDPAVGGACARSRAGCRPPEPGTLGPRDSVQDPGGRTTWTRTKFVTIYQIEAAAWPQQRILETTY
jgi:Winged helix-turn helix